jgi:prolyl-tRNA editing enzyme YbaK/EbsC (Cys-tRNA(Pro) deacylase)
MTPPEEIEHLGPSVRRVQEALDAAGGGHTVVALEQSARTSAEAARAVGCRVDQIAKSLVFRGAETQRAVLVIASGANRVDEVKVAALVAEPVERADADFVRARTGFAIGGVAPVAHTEPLTILIDDDLMTWPEIWAAAGHPNTVFRLTPADLVRLTGGRVASVRTGGGR